MLDYHETPRFCSINEVPSLKKTYIDILTIGVPSIISMFSALFVEVINTSFVGHLGTEEMVAGVGLGNMYINVLCISMAIGLNTTLNTLVSQSFGMKNLHMCGVYLNRARIINSLVYLPLIVILLKA